MYKECTFVHRYNNKTMKKEKKSKRLEFTPNVIKRFTKLAKSKGSNFKAYAENLIINETIKTQKND
jgi:phage regulator Rha-like protein